MTSWYDIIEPHDDIKEGNLDESIFAADLGNVANKTAPSDYNDPSLFYQKTYFTEGINNLLQMVYDKLELRKGPGVIEIKTPFGGGKTHALISIYHYLQNGQKVQNQLPNKLKPINAKTAVIVGTYLNPSEGNRRGDITIQTLWGEIAYQLGGIEGYKEFEKNDAERIAPGKEKLFAFLEKQQPFVILCDEVLEYISRAQNKKIQDFNLATQTYAFFQELTETISSLKNSMVVVTLPSSHLEDYTEQKEESLAKLEKIFGRIESIETPVKGEEIYSIIKRRLFNKVKDSAQMERTILEYFDKYQQHKTELPSKARDIDYKRKMELSYPFHPEVIDILYEKWGTFTSFQRTRGVLRLLANVIEDLYNREKPIDLILPSDIGLGAQSVRQEFLKHIGSEYEGIVGSDISGHEAKSLALDKENKAWKHLAERISTTIFFYSFSGDKSEKGVTLERIKFSVIHLDTIPSMITEVLQQLDKSLWYLNEKGGMFRFSKIPNLNRMILDKKELFNITYKQEMKSILQKEIGNAFMPYLWPKKSEDIPDNREIKLVVLEANQDGESARQWLEKRGNTFRTYKNTVIFAMADATGFGALKEEIKTLLALKEIEDDIKKGGESGLTDRATEITQRMKRIRDDFSYNVRRMYNTLIIGTEHISLGQPTIGRESLSNWYKMELESREKLVSNLHYRFLVNKFLEGNQKVETRVILDQFYKNIGLVIPVSQDVIKRSIQQGISEAAFGLGFGKEGDIDKESIKFESNISTSLISLDEGELLLHKDLVKKLISEVEPPGPTPPEGPGGEPPVIPPVGPPKSGPKRFTKIFLRIEDISSKKIADFSRGVLMPLSKEVGGFNIAMEINIDSKEGVSEHTIKNKVKETLSQIGARITREKIE